jgi:phospholipid-binding lipoprotein MlaA
MIEPRPSRLSLLFLCALVLGGCGTTGHRSDETFSDPLAGKPSDSASREVDPDPFEGFNRAMYKFNEKVDKYALKPVAKGYRAVLPKPVRKGVSNFFSNLREPIVILNDLLQGKFIQAVSDFSRFFWNTTVGLYGLFDVATHMDMPKHDEDFGQTLGVWGASEGPYLVLPFFGPSSVRDTGGLVVDYYAYPPNTHDDVSSGTRSKLLLVDTIDTRARLLDATDILEQAAGQDPYIFVREAYRQRRQYLVYDGNPPQPPPPDFLFEDDVKPGAPVTSPATIPMETPPSASPAQ